MEQPKLNCTLRSLSLYFLRLGATGFGGPIALLSYMRRDLVERKKWLSEEDYNKGLVLSKLAPGPLATQLAIYIGWLHSGVLGAALISAMFILPAFLIVVVLAELYRHYGTLPSMQSAFYGISAAVIAIVAQNVFHLSSRSLEKKKSLLLIALTNALLTLWLGSEPLWAFALSGLIVLCLEFPPHPSTSKSFVLWPALLLNGLNGPASMDTLLKVFVYFLKTGALVFGSGLVILPFLHTGVVHDYHWLNEQQFLDAVSVAMITPGPVVIAVAFIGYQVAGLIGAVLATLGIFLPCFLIVVILSSPFNRLVQNLRARAFLNGITAAAIGAIAGAAILLGRTALIDLPTVLIAALCLASMRYLPKVPDMALIALAALAGCLIKMR